MTIACPDCGTVEDLPPLRQGAAAVCPTCDAWLERTNGRSVNLALAASLTTLMLLFPANLMALMQVRILGMQRESIIWSGVAHLWTHQWVILACLVALFAVVLPFVRFGLLTVVLAAIRFGKHPPWLGRAFRWARDLDMWAMPDVFLVGCFVGYSRISANLPVTIEAGGYCFIGAAIFCMLTRALVERRTVWRAIAPDRALAGDQPAISCTSCDFVMPASDEGKLCPRCGLRLLARKRDAIPRTLALVIAGFILYVPANVYPMSADTQIGKVVSHRIIDGIRELFSAGLWPLGILIFCTSIAFPLIKLLGLSWFMFSIHRGSRKWLTLKTRLFRVIQQVGRWSNVDVFTVAVFLPLLQFGAITHVRAGIGSTAFVLVVVLTMFAARTFDPRLIWDAGTHA